MNSSFWTAVVITIFFGGAVFAQPTQWQLISGTERAREYIDQSTIARAGDTVKVWVLADLDYPRPFKGKTFKSMKSLLEYDCKNRLTRPVHITLYSRQMGAGDVLESNYVNGKWEPVVPQSVADTKMKLSCK